MAENKDKNAEQEVQEPKKKKKKKIKKVDVAQNFLFGVLGIILGLVACIGICVINPNLGKMVSEILQSYKETENTAQAPSNASQIASTSYVYDPNKFKPDTNSDSSDQASSESDNSASEDQAQNTETEGEKTESGQVQNTENAATPTDNSDSAITLTPLVTITASNEKTQPVEEETSEEFTYTPEAVTDRSSMAELSPDIIDVENEKQAKQISESVGYGEKGDGLDFNAEFYPYYNMLDEKSKSLYRQVYANANAFNRAFKPVQNASMSELQNVIQSVAYDHPEIFWLDTTFYTEYDWNGSALKLVLSFYDRIGDLALARNEFEAYASKILEGANNLENPLEKEAYVHDALASKLTYKHTPLDQSAYSAIVQNETVCAGYAKAFQYLMQRLGVPAYLCVGAGAFQLHAWNVVKLGDNYYNVDCTWDDQDPTIYDYFNLPDSINYLHTRMYQSVNLPACNDFSLVPIMQE